MDPFTVALAVFGVQKLRGKSTGRSFRDALLAAGGVQLGAAAGIEGLQGFQGLGASGANALAGEGFLAQLGNTYAGQGISSLIGSAAPTQTPVGAVDVTKGVLTTGTNVADTANLSLTGSPTIGYNTPNPLYNAVTPAAEPKSFLGSAWQDFKDLDTGTKIALGAASLPLVSAAVDNTEPPKPLYTQEDYDKAYATESEKVKGIGARSAPSYTATSPYNYGQGSMYRFNQGGIVDALPKFAVGGINYMPSKISHDENDENNYVRASGYVEDGSGTGDKDTDTILAQLADGEFVSRSDAVLGAGIMAGASPNNIREMRKLGASYFYDQQAKFKRIFDLLDASRKTN
jgi:hypothetical protein